ncbi:hypothetical protein [Planctomicrobium sp. SH527]|uniref:hypothetical protein n=1 Tax=Planctomicrobium sp. SH527 TaxID=3448123 RepID=UPI003F5C323B
MTTPHCPPSLLPFSDWSAQRLQSGNEAYLAFGQPQVNDMLLSAFRVAEQTFLSDGGLPKVIVVPLGLTGNILWHGVPIPAATVVAEVQPEAIAFIRTGTALTAGTNELSSLWQYAASLPHTEVLVTETLAGQVTISQTDELLPRLAPQSRSVKPAILKRIDQLGGTEVSGVAFRSGLMLLLDDLDGSHELSQSVEGVGHLHLGDYWHAIMHRREPDYFNAKYWFRRIGQHPLFDELGTLAKNVLGNTRDSEASDWQKKLTSRGWNSTGFVELCEAVARDEQSPLGIAARQIQLLEMLLLLRFCWAQVSDSTK